MKINNKVNVQCFKGVVRNSSNSDGGSSSSNKFQWSILPGEQNIS